MTTIDFITAGLPEHVAGLLAELDRLITELDGALAEQNAARQVVGDAESEAAIIDASLTLGIEGRNEAERRARLVLALRDDAGYQAVMQTARHARATLHDSERRVTVIKARMALVHAALALMVGERGE